MPKIPGGRNILKMYCLGVYTRAIYITHYSIPDTNRDIPRLFKMHLDHGLEMIAEEVRVNPNLIGFDFLFDKINIGLSEICSQTLIS